MRSVLFLVPYDYKRIGGLYLPLINYKQNLEDLGYIVSFFELPYHLKRRDSSSYLNRLVLVVVGDAYVKGWNCIRSG